MEVCHLMQKALVTLHMTRSLEYKNGLLVFGEELLKSDKQLLLLSLVNADYSHHAINTPRKEMIFND